jgi:hypothetical protein
MEPAPYLEYERNAEHQALVCTGYQSKALPCPTEHACKATN